MVGVGGASNGEHGPWQIPYGALVPTRIDNILAAGRCINSEMRMADLVRLAQLPRDRTCRGSGATVASLDNCPPRTADIGEIRRYSRNKRPTWVESTASHIAESQTERVPSLALVGPSGLVHGGGAGFTRFCRGRGQRSFRRRVRWWLSPRRSRRGTSSQYFSLASPWPPYASFGTAGSAVGRVLRDSVPTRPAVLVQSWDGDVRAHRD